MNNEMFAANTFCSAGRIDAASSVHALFLPSSHDVAEKQGWKCYPSCLCHYNEQNECTDGFLNSHSADEPSGRKKRQADFGLSLSHSDYPQIKPLLGL